MANKTEKQENGAKSKNKILLFGIPLLILLLVGGAVAAFFLGAFDGSGSAEAGASQKEEKNKPSLGPLLNIDNLVVNIMHKETPRFLKIGIALEAKDAKSGANIQSRMPQITDSVLLLVGNKDFDEIKDLQGKLQLKVDLLSRINALLGTDDLKDVFFTDFVVQ